MVRYDYSADKRMFAYGRASERAPITCWLSSQRSFLPSFTSKLHLPPEHPSQPPNKASHSPTESAHRRMTSPGNNFQPFHGP